MSITALDKLTVKKLTTAQVITSVYSAVKELVENALDAGANNIDVILEEQGLSFIEVRDNAKGIDEVDSPFIALAAYTSKLSSFNDLESLETYGFRGEALNAICRVSDLKIITRTEKDDAARCYTINHDGNIEKRELCARSIGTTVQVFSLMKNIPVRRKIICSKKYANQDVEAIETMLQNFGICHPNIRINYKVDNVNRFIKLPTDTVKESLINIFNKKLISNYEFLNFNDSEMKIQIAIPKIDLTDISFACQKIYSRIYINNRPVLYKEIDKLINSLLSKHFGEIMPSKKKPIFFLFINVPSADVDVNLEPNKTRVLLKNNSKLLEVIEKLLFDYYKIFKAIDIDQELALINESEILFMNDSESDDDDINKKLCKKRKIENDKASTIIRKAKTKANTENKENENKIINESNITQLEEETLSQLPKVDLGPDFCTQDIFNIPILDSQSVQNVMEKLENPVVEPKSTDISKSNDPPFQQLSESQWSKGHCKNLKGGTDVEILSPSSRVTKINKEITDSHTNPNMKGFLKFSEKMGQQLQDECPEYNFVTMATSIASKWKQLTPEEREHYRELARQDLTDSKLNLSGGKKRLSKVTPTDMENNKKRMRHMLQKMENLKTTEDGWKNDSVKDNAGQYHAKIRNTRNWKFDKNQIIKSNENKYHSKEKSSFIVGPVDDNIWIVSTNSQIWALNLNHLFNILNLNEQERNEMKGNKNKMIEIYFKRGLNETDNMDFMYPIYSI